MKRRVTAVTAVMLLLSCLTLLGAYNIHQLLSRQMDWSWSMWTCLMAVIRVAEVRRWFLLLECCDVLLVIWMIFSRQHVKYNSGMVKICPGIETPEAAGQGQYGTARWMSDKELEEVFTVIKLSKDELMGLKDKESVDR